MTRLISLLLLLVLLSAASVVSAEIVGVFTEVEGQVTFLRDDYYFEAAEGVEVEDQDLIEAGVGSSTQIEMVDGSVLRLGSNSSLLLSDYQVAKTKNVITASWEVLSGWLRFAVAKLRQDARYEFNTPTLTVGIRGTEGVIEATNEQGALLLEEGAVEVTAAGEQAERISPIRVTAGAFVERRQMHGFRRLARPPAAFRTRVPIRLRRRAERRIDRLGARRVPARAIRRLRQDDVHRYLRQHPPMRQKLERRLRRSRSPDAGATIQQRQPGKVLRSERGAKKDTLLQQRQLDAVDRLINRSRVRQGHQRTRAKQRPRQTPARSKAVSSRQSQRNPRVKYSKARKLKKQRERHKTPPHSTPARPTVRRVTPRRR